MNLPATTPVSAIESRTLAPLGDHVAIANLAAHVNTADLDDDAAEDLGHFLNGEDRWTTKALARLAIDLMHCRPVACPLAGKPDRCPAHG